jgi:lipoprotein Spr
MPLKKESKKLKLGLGCTLIIAVLLLSANEDHFQKIVDHHDDEEVVKKLEEFRKNGIERNLEKENYDSEKVIAEAFSFLGTPARMGGQSHDGIDCSGLILATHKSCGIELPRTAEEQARYGTIVSSIENLRRGDLLFFYNSYETPRLITHVGIYLGENEFIHTSSSKGVTVSRIDDPYYWKERFLFATRL